MKLSTRSRKLNERGVIAFDFLIAFIMIFAFFTLFFALTMTITFIETAQYMTFAVARSYMAGHRTPDDQVDAGRRKFDELRTKVGFRGLFSTNWVEVGPGGVVVGDFNAEYTNAKKTFYGARLPLKFRILQFNNGLLGGTASDDDAFVANVQTFLLREPTTSECEIIMAQRMGFIIPLDAPRNRYQQIGGTIRSTPTDPYVRMLDNGC